MSVTEPLDEGRAGGHVVGFASEQVVEHGHACAGIHEAPGDRGPDEAGATGHEDASSPEGSLVGTVRSSFHTCSEQ